MMLALSMTMGTVKWILAVLYLLMCCFYAYDKFWNTGSIQEALFTVILCVLLPGAGFVIVWMKDYYARKRQDKDFSEIFQGASFFQDELKVLRPINSERDTNIVPMEEALIVNDYELRRKMVMNTLMEDNTMDYLQVLKEALENEDSETSHYASSIIMQLQAGIQNRMIERQREFQENPGDREIMEQYEKELYELLDSGVVETDNLRKYFLQYHALSQEIFREEKPEEIYFQHTVQVYFLEKNYAAAAAVVERYLKQYPKSEDAVLCKIKQCIYTKDHRELERFMESLSGRPVVLTQKTLEYIRFFRGN